MKQCAYCNKECNDKYYSMVVSAYVCSVECVKKIYNQYKKRKGGRYSKYQEKPKKDTTSQGVKKACEWLNM